MKTHNPWRSSDHVASRRRFLQAASLAVASAGVAGRTLGQTPSVAPPPAEELKETLAQRLGIASYSFARFNLDQTLAMTKRLAIKYLCLKSFHLPLDSTPEVLSSTAAKIKEQGLILYGGGGISMRTPAEIDQAFEYARHAGLKLMVIMPTAKTLALIEKKVQEYNILVAVHNHGPGDRHFPTPASVYERIADLDPRIGLCVDVGHTVRYGDDVYAALEKCADRVYDVHLKDVTAATARGRTTILGRGVIDMPRLFRTFQRIRYKGVLAFEYESEARDPLPSVAESVGYARGILAISSV